MIIQGLDWSQIIYVVSTTLIGMFIVSILIGKGVMFLVNKFDSVSKNYNVTLTCLFILLTFIALAIVVGILAILYFLLWMMVL